MANANPAKLAWTRPVKYSTHICLLTENRRWGDRLVCVDDSVRHER